MSHEKPIRAANGWAILPGTTLLFLGSLSVLVLFVLDAVAAEKAGRSLNFWPSFWLLLGDAVIFGLGLFSCFGYFTLQPNEARVLILFGSYRGTVRDSGWRWTNPLNTKMRISLRARNREGDKLKVNDKRGNPIDIAAVVVWRVQDTAQAVFDVQQYEEYVKIQSDSALRHLASLYVYDHGEEHEITLRGNWEEVAAALQKELQERVGKAGVAIEEARLTHLAYAAEVAGLMLRRQQAEAIIDARQKIVHGAVSMVQMALRDLTEKEVVQLDEERKATMVSNLLVVLCGEHDAQPIINAGTLYSRRVPRRAPRSPLPLGEVG